LEISIVFPSNSFRCGFNQSSWLIKKERVVKKILSMTFLVYGLLSTHAQAGLTAIKYWTNYSSEYLSLTNRERPGELFTIEPQSDSSTYKWHVPWVWNQTDVNNKAIEIRANGYRIGCIFQGKNNDGQDRVRFSKSCSFEYTNNSTYVDGNIGVIIRFGREIEFQRAGS
jgi:hypothetical protein